MQRIRPVEPSEARGRTKQLLELAGTTLGNAPNMIEALATSPAALEGYLTLNDALNAGKLTAVFREKIALAVAQANACEYCLSSRSATAKRAGLTIEEIAASRESHSSDPKTEAGLKFAQQIVVQRGEVSDTAFEAVRDAGYTDGDISEIIANVALSIFANYFNHVGQIAIDSPPVSVELE